MWGEYVRVTRRLCDTRFWEIFDTVRDETATCRDRVLSVTKDLLAARGQGWPRSTRVLRDKIKRIAGNFWDLVTQTHTIDLRTFSLPGCIEQVQFSFIDPIYVWITRCTELASSGKKIHWTPEQLHHPETGEEMFGGGIQYSLLLRAASESLPVEGGKPALFNLNWDGGLLGFGARSCTPIQVQVMNTNCTAAMAVGLVGYLPFLDVPKGYEGQQNYKDARHFLLQTCIGKIVDCIEARAAHGFRCDIGGETMLLFPRLGVMSLDTPERVKFFGLRSQASCPICRRRNGRSCARTRATTHSPDEVNSLYNIACAPDAVSVRAPAKRRRTGPVRYNHSHSTSCLLSLYMISFYTLRQNYLHSTSYS